MVMYSSLKLGFLQIMAVADEIYFDSYSSIYRRVVWTEEGGKCIFFILQEKQFCIHISHPIRVVEQGDYHMIVVTEWSGVQHSMMSTLFIP